MADFTKELKTLKLLLKEDILQLRQYIKEKYPHYSHQQQAKVLANAIEKIVGQQLKNFPPQHRQAIQDKLFRGPLISNPDGLFLYDIFEASLSLEIKEEEYLQEVCSWVNRNIQTPIEPREISSYQNKLLDRNFSTETNTKKPVMEASIIEDETPPIDEEIIENKVIPIHSSTSGKVKNPNIANKKIQKTPEKFSFPKGLLKYSIPTYIALSVLVLFLVGRMMLPVSADENIQSEVPVVHSPSHLPPHFHYKEIDQGKLKAYLHSRNSLLQQEPYFSAILEVAKEFGLNPLVLFAIAGHEQGFVPQDHPSALKIANNPFNVFHSWQEYNKDITDSSRIAARTVINLAKDRPEETDIFQWINRKYAEDEHWWKGVKSIYNRLEKEVE